MNHLTDDQLARLLSRAADDGIIAGLGMAATGLEEAIKYHNLTPGLSAHKALTECIRLLRVTADEYKAEQEGVASPP